MSNTKINLYLVDLTIDIGIVKSQLIKPLIVGNDLNFHILMPKHFAEDKIVNHISERIILYNSTFNKFKIILKNGNNIESIYTRSVVEFFVIFLFKIFLFKSWEFTYDFRGLVSSESSVKNFESYGSKIRNNILLFLEKLAYQKSTYVRTVSNNFKIYLISKYGGRENIRVLPCCVSANDVFKRDFKNTNDLKFVYLGSINAWQRFEDSLELYKKIEAKVGPSSLTIITKNIDEAMKICNEKGINCKIISLPQEKVKEELRKYDYGFMLREDILMNNVASPVKFIEYLSQGVIPIISKGIGDYTKIVEVENIGVIVNSNMNEVCNKILGFKQDEDIYNRIHKVVSDYTWEFHLISNKKNC